MKNADLWDRWISRTSNVATLLPLLIPAGIVGLIVGFASQSLTWIATYGTFGWVVISLLAFIMCSGGAAGIAFARERWIHASATSKWQRIVDNVNPMRSSFSSERIKIHDLSHPFENLIYEKTFTDCDLLGPANIAMMGQGTFSSVRFADCDFIIVKEQAYVRNVILLNNCNMVRGSISRCSIFLVQPMFDSLKQMGAVDSVTYEQVKT